MAMQESGEMYLETIYVLSQQSAFVRSIDVAEEMGFSKPSVSRGVGLLKKEGLLLVDDTVLTAMLVKLGVREETAAEDACRIEHYISDETFQAVKAHMRKYDKEE